MRYQQTQNVWKSGYSYSNLAQSQMLFYKDEQCILPDNCTKYEHNHHILLQDISTLKMYEKIAIITQIWYKAKFYFTDLSGPWYLIMVPILWRKSWRNTQGRLDRRINWDWSLSYIPRFHLLIGRAENMLKGDFPI